MQPVERRAVGDHPGNALGGRGDGGAQDPCHSADLPHEQDDASSSQPQQEFPTHRGPPDFACGESGRAASPWRAESKRIDDRRATYWWNALERIISDVRGRGRSMPTTFSTRPGLGLMTTTVSDRK